MQEVIYPVDSWIMIAEDKTNKIGLYIAKNIIAMMRYHLPNVDITWEHCALRTWLNNEFYATLPDSIKSRVVEVINQNPNNHQFGTPGGNPTHDKVFILSFEEALLYLPSDEARVSQFENWNDWWWLRTPGMRSDRAARVNCDGTFLVAGYSVTDEYGVRPALWLRQ